MMESTVNSLIRSLGNVMVEKLLWVWRKMKENGIDPSLYTYNFLLNGLVNLMFIESAEKVFGVMEGGRIRPDVVSYNTMIKGYCMSGKTRKCMELLREMEGKTIEPDKITYMTLMQACYTEGDFDSCLRIYHNMEEKDLEIPPHGYTLVISGLCKDGKCMEEYSVYNSMVRNGCKAAVAVYTALIDSYAKCGSMEETMRIFEKMKDDGFQTDEVTYGAVINGLCKLGRLEEAMFYSERCRESGLAVNPTIYSSLIDGYGKAGRVDETEKIFEEMVEMRCSRPDDDVVYDDVAFLSLTEKVPREAVVKVPEENPKETRRVWAVPRPQNDSPRNLQNVDSLAKQENLETDMSDIEMYMPPPPPPPAPPTEFTAVPAMPVEKSRIPSPKNSIPSISAKSFTIAALQQYTNSFSKENVIGSVMLGSVYRTELPNGRVLAVKKLDKQASDQQKDVEFLHLVNDIDKIRHANVVELMGYCAEHGQRLLIF